MTVVSPTRLSFDDPNPSHAVSLLLELAGTGHVTGSYNVSFAGMGGFTLTIDVTRLP